MSEPNEQDRQRAREIVISWAADSPHRVVGHKELYEAIATALAEARAEKLGKHKWVTCPVCEQPDMLAVFEGDENDPTGHGWLVQCCNLACESNISIHADDNRAVTKAEGVKRERGATLRAELAEKVAALKVHSKRVSDGSPMARDYYEVCDVLAILEKE